MILVTASGLDALLDGRARAVELALARRQH